MSSTSKTIWPMSIRLIHWSIAVIILLNVFIIEEGDPPHRYIGYVGVALICMRFYFGMKIFNTKKFSQFNFSLNNLQIFFAKHFRKVNPIDYEGHNPLASLVYFLMWLSIILLAVTGWMMGLDRFWGDETLEQVHSYLSLFLEALIVIHLIGMALDAVIFKRKTWMRMIK
jgi:cytochrome b